MFENPKPARINPPGSLIARELEARGWSQKDLADIMGRPVQVINEILKGTKQITVSTAIELSEAFDTTPELWVNLETKYRLFLARQSKGNNTISQKSKIYGKAPISEMIKRKWIPAEKKLQRLEFEVCKFLDIANIDDEPQIALNMRHAQGRKPQDMALIAWMARAGHLAAEQFPAKFDRSKILSLVKDLLSLTQIPEDVAKVKTILLDYGIRFVLVPHLPKTYLDGAVFFLDGMTRQQPVIAMTMRYDRIDWFWFTLFHELAHLYKDHYSQIGFVFDGETIEGNDNSLEKEADDLAAEWLIPAEEYSRYSDNFFIGLSDVKSLAFLIGRHPGIVLGRFQRDNKIPYSRHRSMLVRVKPYLADFMDCL